MFTKAATESLRFCFDLDNAAEIPPWDGSEGPKLHWFGLTSGRYWIETPLGEILRYTEQIRNHWNYPYLYADYQVARFFEDLQEQLPAILEPVPNDIVQLVSNPDWRQVAESWLKSHNDQWELYDSAVSSWWDQQRGIDTAYLKYGPYLIFWRTDKEMHFRWAIENNDDEGTEVFLSPNGEITLSSGEFEKAAFGFCESVLSAMKQRVESIERDGWNRADCHLDVRLLVADQKQREERFAKIRSQCKVTDWDEVRYHLALLQQQIPRN